MDPEKIASVPMLKTYNDTLLFILNRMAAVKSYQYQLDGSAALAIAICIEELDRLV